MTNKVLLRERIAVKGEVEVGTVPSVEEEVQAAPTTTRKHLATEGKRSHRVVLSQAAPQALRASCRASPALP